MPDRSTTAPRSWADAIPDAHLRVYGVIGFALLTAILAQVRVPMYPVPMTLQTLGVTACALTLGPRLGLASMGLYVLLGLLGMPMFSGLASGPAVLLGATGGYIIGFVLAQPVVAWLAARTRASWLGLTLAVLAGHAIVFAIGVPWLRAAANLPWGEAMLTGFIVFIPGMILKTAVAVLIGRRAVPAWQRRGW